MKKEFKIGVFTIVMILGAWGGVRFLSGSDIFKNERVYYSTYEDIDGLQQASPVYIQGVKVGSVSDIKLNIKDGVNVVITLAVSNQYDIPKDSKCKIFSDGLIGSKAVELQIGRSSEYLTSGGSITSIPSVDLFDVATEELQYLKSKIDTVTNELSTTLQNLNTMLEGNAEHLGSMITNLDALSHNLNKLIEENGDSATRAIDGFAEFSQTLGSNSDNIESIINNIDTLTQDLNNAEIDGTLQEINSILSKINRGEGNMGKVVSDEALYANLSSATANLDSLLYDFKQNPKRYVHFSLFGRSETKQIEKANKRAEREARRTE